MFHNLHKNMNNIVTNDNELNISQRCSFRAIFARIINRLSVNENVADKSGNLWQSSFNPLPLFFVNKFIVSSETTVNFT